ncbi:hypothetical protein [Mycobacterium sp. URHB0021]|jgi:hypothetical protein
MRSTTTPAPIVAAGRVTLVRWGSRRHRWAYKANEVKSSKDSKALHGVGTTYGAGAASGVGGTPGMGGGYGPMAALGRSGSGGREHESSLQAGTLDGGGEPGAALSWNDVSRLPAAQQGDAPFTVSNVSWGPSTSVFDELATPAEPAAIPYADEPSATLERVSDRWVSPPVIGVDRELTL